MKQHGHSKADARNLHLHRLAIAKLRRQPELKTQVMDVLDRWLASESHAPSRPWLEQWRVLLLDSSLERLAEVVFEGDRGQVLRQYSPLAPVLTPQERWAALRQINGELQSGTPSLPTSETGPTGVDKP